MKLEAVLGDITQEQVTAGFDLPSGWMIHAVGPREQRLVDRGALDASTAGDQQRTTVKGEGHGRSDERTTTKAGRRGD